MFIVNTRVLSVPDRAKFICDLKRVSWEVFSVDRDDLDVKALIPKGKTPADLLPLQPGVTFYKL